MTFTTEEIALMAKEAGLIYIPQPNSPLVRIVHKAVQLEREACAQVCEAIEDEYQRTEGRRYPELKSDAETGARDCASAIRARSAA